MVRFLTVRFKHYRIAKELIKKDASAEETFAFVIELVAEWDFKDADTGEALPVELASMDELSIKQFNEAMQLFNLEMGLVTKVKKTTGEPSYSTSSLSNKEESPEISPTG